jgi:hypothetical protein
MVAIAAIGSGLRLEAAGGPALLSIDGTVTVLRPRGAASGGGEAPGDLRNGDFTAGLDAWIAEERGGSTAPGGVAASGGDAVLREGDSFLVTLSQAFTVPAGASLLSFTVRLDPGFDRTDSSIPDAFEVSLLDADGGPVVGSWDALATSFLNVGEDGTVRAGPRAAWDGSRGTVNLGGVPSGMVVTLYFDLIGADRDAGSAVTVDDVQVALSPLFVRGNVNGDDHLDISDPISLLGYLYLGDVEPPCLDAADVDDNGLLEITDPIVFLAYFFLGGPAFPAPFPACGPDPGEPDGLGCATGSCPNI